MFLGGAVYKCMKQMSVEEPRLYNEAQYHCIKTDLIKKNFKFF